MKGVFESIYHFLMIPFSRSISYENTQTHSASFTTTIIIIRSSSFNIYWKWLNENEGKFEWRLQKKVSFITFQNGLDISWYRNDLLNLKKNHKISKHNAKIVLACISLFILIICQDFVSLKVSPTLLYSFWITPVSISSFYTSFKV